jgi:hypothetical protein
MPVKPAKKISVQPTCRTSILINKNEFLRKAAEFRELARMASPDHRIQLDMMAGWWQTLAENHKQDLEDLATSVDADKG